MKKSEPLPSGRTAFCSCDGGFPHCVDSGELESAEAILDTLYTHIDGTEWSPSARQQLVRRLLKQDNTFEWVRAMVMDPEVAYPILFPAILKHGSSSDWLELCWRVGQNALDTRRLAERFASEGQVEDLLAFVYNCRKNKIPLTKGVKEKLRNRAGQLDGERGLARYDLTCEGIFWPFRARGFVSYPGVLMPWPYRLAQLQEKDLGTRLKDLGFEPAVGIAGILAALDRRLGLKGDADRAAVLNIRKGHLCAWAKGVREPDNRELFRIGQLLGVHDPSMAGLFKTIQQRYGRRSHRLLASALSVSPRTIERWAQGRTEPPARLIPALLFIAESNRVTWGFQQYWRTHDPRNGTWTGARRVWRRIRAKHGAWL